jgi:2-polyprenyl-3-methyl-5-hydroxy-6-metoxy-1,4-benzoquinol methylase
MPQVPPRKPRADVYHRDFSAGLSGKYRRVYDLVPSNSRVLELGCSTGYFTDHLLKNCAEVVAVDLDPVSVKACQARGITAFEFDLSSNYIDSLLTDQPPFDAVVAMDVLEHLPDPQSLLVQLRKHMNSSSRLIVTGPNVANWHVRWQLLRGHWNYAEGGVMDETHLRWFTRATWRKLLEDSGFVIVADEVVDSLLPKEYQLRALPVPGFGSLLDRIKGYSEKAFPTLMALVFLFCCQLTDKQSLAK